MKFWILIFSFIFCHTLFAMQGMIIRSKGTVLLDGVPIIPNQVVKVGQILEAVGEKSYCQVSLSGGTSILVRNGKVRLEEDSSKASVIALLRGTIFNAVKKNSKKEFRIVTDKASMAVRGTLFYVENTEQQTYLCVCDGEVAFSGDKRGPLAVRRGEDIWYKKGATVQVTPVKSDMWKAAKEGFSLMEIDIGKLNP